jgi:hypothetical protein
VVVRRTLALFVLLSIALCSCAGRGAGAAASPLAGPFSQRTVDAVVHLLAGSGVAVVGGLGGGAPQVPVDGPPSPLRVWAWQARSLAVETAGGGGLPGAEIDALAPVPTGVVPLSYLLAAYVSAGRTQGAQALRALIGSRDWKHPEHIIFPTLAWALLASDLARSVHPRSAARLLRTTALGPASGPCSVVSQWVNDTLDLLFAALNQVTSALLPTFLAQLVGVGLALARGALGGLISALTAPVVDAIRAGVSLLALAFEAASVLQPWSLQLRNSPQPNSYSNRQGSVLLTVLDQGPIDWPQPLQDCARQVTGRDLPQLRGAANAPVAWKVDGSPDSAPQTPLTALDGSTAAQQTSLDAATHADRTAALGYVTSSEPPPCRGATPLTTTYVISVEVTRADADTVRSLIPNLLGSVLARIPGLLRPIFTQAVNDISARVSAALLAIAGHDTAFALLSVEHHDSASCTSEPSPSPSPTPEPPPRAVTCSELPALGPPDATLDVTSGPARGFTALLCDYHGGASWPSFKGFILIQTYPGAGAAQSAFNGPDGPGTTAQVLPGLGVEARTGGVQCTPDPLGGQDCTLSVWALKGSRIYEVTEGTLAPDTRSLDFIGAEGVLRQVLARA